LIYSFEDIINPKMSVKVIGNQWYWTYEMDSWLDIKIIQIK
jgi:heme/copper-type cytochrome/quinol oxidase subunit 2